MNQIHSISLNGAWNLHWFDQLRGAALARLLSPNPDTHSCLPAQVPGAVHLDLARAGLIAEPTEGLNAYTARWVEETTWHYQRNFTAPDLQPGEHAYLVFDCLDLAATIYLNGQEVGKHANAFYPCRIEVTASLRSGQNSLVVAIESGLFSVADRPGKGYGLGYDGTLTKRHWLRQTQSTFGWDWSPRLLNVGIRGEVRLEICSGWRVESLVCLAELDEDLNTGYVTVRAFVAGLGDAPVAGCLRISLEKAAPILASEATSVIASEAASVIASEAKQSQSREGDCFGEERLAMTENVNITPGMNRIEMKLAVPQPALWWPVGHGEQALYTVNVCLAASEQVVEATQRVGFRKVEVDQAPHPEGGRYFIIRVNHQPIFCKGGNFVPADPLLARLDRRKYELLIQRALESNFNLLRVWGGGLYESEDFYDLCDEKGLLVWQEFIFACAKYPLHDEAFLADVRREATYQVRRLAHRPSLVVWCGNNELEWGAWEWGYDKGVALPDYALYHLELPRILQQEDGTRYYQPGSPYSPDLQPPNADELGDQHPWSLGFTNTDFRGYRQMICRFPNEGGFLGPTALPTLLACLPGATPETRPFAPGADRRFSFLFEAHDNTIAAQFPRNHADAMLEQWLGKSMKDLSLAEYAYYGGLVQGAALGEYIRNFRRRMFDSSSAIFWMYNDCWPATRSWTTVDYYGRRTPSFHPVRRAFQPLTVCLAVEGDMVGVYVVNEGPDWQGDVRYGVVGLAGGYPIDRGFKVKIIANSARLIAGFRRSEWETLGLETHVGFAILTENGREIARDVLIQPLYKEMGWSVANVAVRVENGRAIFTCDTFAFRVCLDLDGEKPYPDNFFDILPGIPTVLDWPEELGKPSILYLGNLTSS